MTELKRLEGQLAALRERNAVLESRLEGIQTIASSLGGTLGLDEILHTVGAQVTRALSAQRATIYLVNEESQALEARVIIGPEMTSLSLAPGQGIAGWVASSGKTVNIKDAYKDRRFDPTFDQATGFKTQSILCQPMKNYRGRTIGVVQVLNKVEGYFSSEDADVLSTITTQATISIENSKFFLQLQESNIRLREAQDNLRRNYARLETVYNLQSEIAHSFDREILLDKILPEVARAISCQAVALLLVRPGAPTLKVYNWGDDTAVRTVRPAAVGGILGSVTRGGDGYSPEGRQNESLLFVHPEIDLGLVHVIADPLKDSDGESVGAIAVARKRIREPFSAEDVQTLRIVSRQIAVALDRLLQHEELTRSNNLALIGQALSGVLHDLKSPMSIISGYVQLMEMEDSPDKRGEFAKEVIKQFRHVAAMTQEVLAFSRGEAQILKRPIYLQEFLSEMKVLLDKEFEGRGVMVQIQNEYKGKLKADENKLKRLVFNLARNARDAMERGGSFSIQVKEVDGHVALSFTDTGHGIPEGVQERMFQSFVTQGKKDGTGLGLAIVKNIVDQHGGTITFSTRKDVGTTFNILLPKEG